MAHRIIVAAKDATLIMAQGFLSMGRGDRKTQAPLPTLAKIAPKKKQPRVNGKFSADVIEEDRVVLDARCRRYGVGSGTQSRLQLSAASCSHDLGLIMLRAGFEQSMRARNWGTWSAWTAAERTYSTRIIGQTGDPKGSTIAMVSEPMATDESHSVDLRDSETRDNDAVTNWMRWRGYIGRLGTEERVLLHRARREEGKPLWVDGFPTRDGTTTLAALVRLTDIVEAKT